MLKLNSNGLLVPDRNIQTDIVELEKTFVTAFQSVTRKRLFDNYISYSIALKELCKDQKNIQWIDGSFVTNRPNPDDIDLVTFIDFSIVEKLKDDLTAYKYPNSQNNFGVDAYIIKVYPIGHKYYQSFLADKAYWMNHFSKTKRNRVGNKLKKGVLEINM
jgi:hypothetical protein